MGGSLHFFFSRNSTREKVVEQGREWRGHQRPPWLLLPPLLAMYALHMCPCAPYVGAHMCRRVPTLTLHVWGESVQVILDRQAAEREGPGPVGTVCWPAPCLHLAPKGLSKFLVSREEKSLWEKSLDSKVEKCHRIFFLTELFPSCLWPKVPGKLGMKNPEFRGV